MIFLTRFDGTEVVVNSDLIVTVEKIPDTVVTLTTGDRIMVKEPVDEVVARAAAYRHRVMQGPGVRADVQDIVSGLAAASGAILASGSDVIPGNGHGTGNGDDDGRKDS
ncbi:MAG: flagellar FlbD family protein [Deltaproteobacteria bacterium]|nr:flagellar FlbD family protein [Deltaproteobacteria bacterium]